MTRGRPEASSSRAPARTPAPSEGRNRVPTPARTTPTWGPAWTPARSRAWRSAGVVAALSLLPALVWALALTGLPLPAAAAPPTGDEVPELLPVPAPDLAEADPAIREQLADHREALDRALAAPGESGGAGEPSSGDPRGADSAAPGGLAALFGRMGQLYFLYGYDDAARAAFENARRLAPDDLRWPYYLGVLHERRGELEAAARELGSVLDRRPGDAPTLLHLGSVALQANRLDESEQRYRAALEAGADAAAHYGLGRIALERGEPARAVELLERVLAEHPDSGAVHYQLGLAYRQLGDLERAREHLARRGGEPPAFRDPLVDGLSLLSTGAAVHMDRGNRAMARDRPEEAIEHYRRVVDAAPGDRRAREALASALARSGRAEEALDLYRELARGEEATAVAHYNLGRLLADRGELEEAVAELRRAVELAPDFGNAHYNLATALEQTGRTEEALDAASRAVAAQPEDRGSRLLLARLSSRAGHPERAEEELRRLLAADPEDGEALLALGSVLETRERRTEALETYRRAAALDGHPRIQARAHVFLADLVSGGGRTRDGDGAALEHLDRAAELAPELPEVHLARASALGQAGRYADAAAAYGRAVELAPGDAAAHFGRATALLVAGREGAARRRLEESVQALPEDLALRHALARLLATAEDPAVRNGARALELAVGVFRSYATVEHGATVAMALAEVGRFDEAVAWQQRVLDRARQMDRAEELPELREHLERYRAGEPVRTPWRP